MKHVDEGKAYTQFRQAIQVIVDDVVAEGLPIIDCDEPLFSTDKVFPEIHHKDGKLEWNIERQANALLKVDGLTHNELYLIRDKHVLNANVLDYLLEHPYLIPNEWCGKVIHFLGTKYRDYSDNYHSCYSLIRSMHQKEDSEEWSWEYNICDEDLCCLTGYIALTAVQKKT